MSSTAPTQPNRTILGKRADAAAAPPPATITQLARRRLGIARGQDVELPVLGRAWMELVGHRVTSQIESEVFAELDRLNLRVNELNAYTIGLERSARTLAAAVRDPDDRDQPFGTLSEWLEQDDDLILNCYSVYMDVRNRLDPVATDNLSDDDFNQIRLAIEKKNLSLLRDIGVTRLSIWLLTTVAQQSISPTPRSSTSQSSLESLVQQAMDETSAP